MLPENETPRNPADYFDEAVIRLENMVAAGFLDTLPTELIASALLAIAQKIDRLVDATDFLSDRLVDLLERPAHNSNDRNPTEQKEEQPK